MVCTRTSDHADHAVERAARRGKHLLLEKPGAITAARAGADRRGGRGAPRARREGGLPPPPRRALPRAGRRDRGRARSASRSRSSSRAARTSRRATTTSPRAGSSWTSASTTSTPPAGCSGEDPTRRLHAGAQPGLPRRRRSTTRTSRSALAARRRPTHLSRTSTLGMDIRCEVIGPDGSIMLGQAAVGRAARDPRGRVAGAPFPADCRDRFARRLPGADGRLRRARAGARQTPNATLDGRPLRRRDRRRRTGERGTRRAARSRPFLGLEFGRFGVGRTTGLQRVRRSW